MITINSASCYNRVSLLIYGKSKPIFGVLELGFESVDYDLRCFPIFFFVPNTCPVLEIYEMYVDKTPCTPLHT